MIVICAVERQLVRPGMIAWHSAKAVLLASTVLLALAGAGAAEERDPRLKDPTIDFNTVDLSTLPPLQFTFVPEWRKLEGFRRRLLAGTWNQDLPLSEPTDPGFCDGFWDALRNGEGIETVEPIVTTNDVGDLVDSPLKQMCPDWPLGQMRHSPLGQSDLQDAYGMRLYDVSIEGEKRIIYERGTDITEGFFIEREKWPPDGKSLSKYLQSADDPYSYRRHSYVDWISERECVVYASQYSTSFYLNSGRAFSMRPDSVAVVRYKGEFLSLSTSDDLYGETSSLLLSFPRNDGRVGSVSREMAVVSYNKLVKRIGSLGRCWLYGKYVPIENN